MAVKIRNMSRLIHSDLREDAGVEFWELPEYPEIVARQDDIFHVVDQSDRLDLMAAKYYQDPLLWWVIAMANGIKLVPTDLEVGMKLRIPAPRYVLSELVTPR